MQNFWVKSAKKSFCSKLTARVKRALSDVQTAMSKGGRQRRDVKNVQRIDGLERKAAELLKRLDTKEG